MFVVCVNNDTLFLQTKNQIANLWVPEGYSVEIIDVRNAESMAQGYNQVNQLEAVMKIYIHQDVFLIHQGMLQDLLQLFQKYPQLGMVGLAGCVDMPDNGIWWEGKELVGQVIEYRRGNYQLLRFGHGSLEPQDYIKVNAIDGLFMATRVDIPWREDLFDGFHFYDSSQSMEMQRAGYEVGIPVLQSPWCIHFSGDEFDPVTYEKYRQIFVQHYLNGDR